MSTVLIRKFGEEAVQFLGKKVSVETSDQRVYKGTLTGIDERLDLVLNDVEGHWNPENDHQWCIRKGD